MMLGREIPSAAALQWWRPSSRGGGRRRSARISAALASLYVSVIQYIMGKAGGGAKSIGQMFWGGYVLRRPQESDIVYMNRMTGCHHSPLPLSLLITALLDTIQWWGGGGG
mmetsp:Transcript_31020/g.74977  ORF Transcript_31020/g.74977 Transcript_31020/m.74977 type:complete len:111 (+) Transcript_31020:2642-2974(+)